MLNCVLLKDGSCDKEI